MYFDFSDFLSKRPVADLCYRFLLWFFFSIFLWWLASISQLKGGAYIKEAMVTGNKGLYWNILSMIAIVLFSSAMWFRHLDLKVKNQTIKKMWAYPTSFLTKISSDALGVSFALASGMLGYIVFFTISNFDIGEHFWFLIAISTYGITGTSLFIGVIGICIWILRSTHLAKVSAWMSKCNLLIVLFIYPLVTVALSAILWFYKP
jgi:hypothetical protein